MKFFDTHAHLNISPLSDDAELIVNECIKNKLLVNNVGVNIKTSQIAIDQAKKYKNVYASVGIHPTEVNNFDLAQSMLELEEMLKNKKQNKIIAVGETGFDFHYDKTNFYLQKKFFEAHLKLALKYKLPLILHIRDAYEESFEILQKIPKDINVLIHCFDSTVDVVKKYSKLDFYIAFGGKITYPKTNQHLLDVLDVVNSERILCETDAP
jgi:TatD DNase family protein